MNLAVGIADAHPGWELLLKQEGVPYSLVADLPRADTYAVIVAGNRLDYRQSKFLNTFLEDGGALLCSTRAFACLSLPASPELLALSPTSLDESRRASRSGQRGEQAGGRQASFQRCRYTGDFVEYVVGGDEGPFRSIGVVDISRGCQILPQANALRTNHGTPSAYVGSIGRGSIVVLPFDPAETMLYDDSLTKSFYSKEKRLPFERVATLHKGGVARIVRSALQYLFAQRGLPYCHSWYYPGSEPTLFLFRVDTDHGTEERIRQLASLAQRRQIPFTWFVDVQSQQFHLNVFKELQGHEVAVHGYEHRVFSRKQEFERDLRTALSELERSGLHPEGVAAPYGAWTHSLGEAMQSCRFQYSSEFSYDYDSLPGYPLLSIGASDVLQIPI
ncbi:MAG: polysaccharide deacetylase family protein, partial [Ignavibacteriales bacterium]|nr:polysaccharide deacetylase family protein [Ignavibacteriales bacterium]